MLPNPLSSKFGSEYMVFLMKAVVDVSPSEDFGDLCESTFSNDSLIMRLILRTN